MYITFQTGYNLKYFSIQLSLYMNDSTEPEFISPDMAFNITCITLINLSYIWERIFSKSMRLHINGSSRRVSKKLTKLSNNPTFFKHNVTHITQDIYLKVTISPQKLISSISPPYTGVPRKIQDIPNQLQFGNNSNVQSCVRSELD